MSLREELIQVAAVAVAIVQDLTEGTTSMELTAFDNAMDDVEAERYRQEAKWGPRHHTPEVWLAILAEEVGEAAREIAGSDVLLQARLIDAEIIARHYLKERFGSE